MMCVCSLLSWCFSNLPSVESRAKQQSCHRSEPGQLRGPEPARSCLLGKAMVSGAILRKRPPESPENPLDSLAICSVTSGGWTIPRLQDTRLPKSNKPSINKESSGLWVHFCAIFQFQKVVGATPLNLDTSPKITQLKEFSTTCQVVPSWTASHSRRRRSGKGSTLVVAPAGRPFKALPQWCLLV